MSLSKGGARHQTRASKPSPASAYVNMPDSAGVEINRARERKPRGLKSSLRAYRSGDPIVRPGIVSADGAFKGDIGIPIPIEPVRYRILAHSDCSRHWETAWAWPWPGTRS